MWPRCRGSASGRNRASRSDQRLQGRQPQPCPDRPAGAGHQVDQVRPERRGAGERIPIATSRGFEIEIAEVIDGTTIGPWVDKCFYTNSRNMRIGDMIPGKTYAVRVRAMGGLTRMSDWSVPSTHMVA